MSKKLVGSHNVTDFICTDDNTIRVDSGMILSPGAKDIIRTKGVAIVYDKKTPKAKSQVKEKSQEKVEEDQTSSLIAKVIVMLRKDFGIVDKDQIRDISLLVMKKLVTE